MCRSSSRLAADRRPLVARGALLGNLASRADGCVITRRFSNTEDQIPIGICGKERHQRFATSIPRRLVRRIVTPPELLRLVDRLSNKCFPALLSLKLLKQRWLDLKLPWGPIGSVSRELLIGDSVVSAHSDLDIVIRAEAIHERRRTIARSQHAGPSGTR
jgi:phosphoribosyl-dephospho-CoA transferase